MLCLKSEKNMESNYPKKFTLGHLKNKISMDLFQIDGGFTRMLKNQ